MPTVIEQQIDRDLLRLKEIIMVDFHGRRADEALRCLEDLIAAFGKLPTELKHQVPWNQVPDED